LRREPEEAHGVDPSHGNFEDELSLSPPMIRSLSQENPVEAPPANSRLRAFASPPELAPTGQITRRPVVVRIGRLVSPTESTSVEKTAGLSSACPPVPKPVAPTELGQETHEQGRKIVPEFGQPDGVTDSNTQSFVIAQSYAHVPTMKIPTRTISLRNRLQGEARHQKFTPEVSAWESHARSELESILTS
jgi:hypothetical protein